METFNYPTLKVRFHKMTALKSTDLLCISRSLPSKKDITGLLPVGVRSGQEIEFHEIEIIAKFNEVETIILQN